MLRAVENSRQAAVKFPTGEVTLVTKVPAASVQERVLKLYCVSLEQYETIE